MATMDALAYEVVEGWEQLPAGYRHADVPGVAVDSNDRLYMITRGDPRVIVYEPDGRFVASWGEEVFTPRTHGITIGPDDSVYCSDDGNHTVRKFTPDGRLLLTLGTPNVPSDTGYDGSNLATITRGGPPFNRPTNLAVGPNGNLYVSDGYGNARVHQFRADGELIRSWGEPGTGPGQFNLPHGIAVDGDGRVLVADRENDRIQVFSPDGEYLEEWSEVQRPTQIYVAVDGRIYVSELWWKTGQRSCMHGEIGEDRFGAVRVLDQSGRTLARVGGGKPGTRGNFCAPHRLCGDSRGDLYVGEVTYTFAISRGADAPATTPAFQKLARKTS
ncbi:MAG: peptidyl-alpha-hydroxyglycine alpha-amidating lyase family protein [Chloroflexota bacterium]|nr:peptidyl-alpha-hydroxyglycine alpha-amidating lyase family protein [Chloroflexota bacterium]